jgi:hypothetical protein
MKPYPKPQHIVRTRFRTPEEVAQDEKIRKAFAHKPSKADLIAAGDYVGPMSIEEYLAWRRGEAEAPLSKQLREAVKSCGQTVTAIAEASGVPQPVLQRFVAGQRGITLDTAGKLAAYLRLSLLPTPGSKQ